MPALFCIDSTLSGFFKNPPQRASDSSGHKAKQAGQQGPML